MPKHQAHNLEADLMTDQHIVTRVREDQAYAQNLYAALCNTQWQHQDVWTKLKDITWSCSWRHAGGIVSDMRKEGDYMDWYCSGMGGVATYNLEEGEVYMAKMKYVPEGTITDEIATDLDRLGWFPVPYDDDGV